MLVLSRKPKETIQIGPDVVVKVLGYKGDRVRLGIQAPQGTKIVRGEIEVEVGPSQERKEA